MAKSKQLPKPTSPAGTKTASSKAGSARAGASKKPVSRPWLLWAVIGAVVLVVAGIALLQAQSLRKPADTTVQVGEGMAWGPENAKVKIVEYSDFGCSHCRDFAENQGPQLRAEYEATGKVRFEFKSFILGPTTAAPANAAACAADQGRFWNYHDLLFSRQGVDRDPFSKASLKQYATSLALDTAKFNRCVDNDQFLPQAYRQTSEAKGLGLTGTPAIFVNGALVPGGAVPYATLKARVDAALAAP